MKPIKNILLATEMSSASKNQVAYASELTKMFSGKIFLLHTYNVPIPATEVDYVYIRQIEEDVKSEIAEKFHQIENDFFHEASPPYTFIMKQGSVESNIQRMIKEHRIDLLVMGSSGPHGVWEVFGSHTTHLIDKVAVPVFIVPENVPYKPMKNILLACDLKQLSAKLEVLAYISHQYRSRVYTLTVQETAHSLTPHEMKNSKILNKIMHETEYEHHYLENENIEKTIEEYIEKKNIDLLSLIPYHHNLLDKILQKSLTKKMIFHAHIPLLILPQ